MRTARTTHDGTTRTYRLAGLVTCGVCGRRLDSHTVNNRPGYRCRHGHTSARARPLSLVKTVCIAERRLLTELASHLSPTIGEGTSVADYLYLTRQVIVCTGPTWTIAPADLKHDT
jgi:hypothetical protein